MATLHLIHGFIGSGKTTFAKRLERKTGALRLTQDEWMVALHGINPPMEKFAEYEARVRIMLWQWTLAALEDGRDVIQDAGCWSRAGRDDIRQQAARLGFKVKLYSARCSRDEMLKRTLARTAALPAGTLVIDENAFNVLWPKFEPLGADEVAEGF